MPEITPQPPLPAPPNLTCTACRYDLSGLPISGLCPECGLPIRSSILYPWPEMRHAASLALGSLVLAVLCTVVASMMACSGNLGAACIVFCLPSIAIAHTHTQIVAATPLQHRAPALRIRPGAIATPILIALTSAATYATLRYDTRLDFAVVPFIIAATLSTARNHAYLRTLRALNRANLLPSHVRATQPFDTAAQTVTNIALATFLLATAIALLTRSELAIILSAIAATLWTIWSAAWAGSLFRISQPRPHL